LYQSISMMLMEKNWRALNYWEDTKSKDKMPARKEGGVYGLLPHGSRREPYSFSGEPGKNNLPDGE
jgi:hypothetical protein